MWMIYVLFVALALYHRNKETYIYYKTLTSATFVITGIYFGYCKQDYSLVPTLLGFFIGDIMLASKLKRNFIYGMGGFFIADVWLISRLYQWNRVSITDFILPIFVISFIKYISKSPKMHLGHYIKPMCVYGTILSIAVSGSVRCYLGYRTEAFFVMALGMVFYFLSDFLLMFQYFYTTKYRDVLKIAKMVFYFVGAFLIACSIGM